MQAKKKSLALCMIVRDEEKTLARCLESVKNLADEIVIVDTGSNDKSPEIAEKFNASVFYFNWNNNFSEARNFSIGKTSSDFILYLDADEELTAESRALIQEILTDNSSKAYRCVIKNIDDFSGRVTYGTYCRLFPNKKGIEFRGRVHEQIEDSLLERGVEIVDSEIEIVHHGYNIDDEGKAAKAKRNLPLLLEEFKHSPSPYYAYQLGLTYSIIEDYRSAENYFNYAYKSKSLPEDYKLFSLQFLINFALKRKDFDKAKKLVDEIFEFNISHPSVFYVVAKVYSALKDYEKALMYCSAAYELNLTPFNTKTKNLVLEKLNNEEIIFYGIFLSLQSNSDDYFTFFTKKLKEDLAEYEMAEIFTDLKNGKKLSPKRIGKLLNKVNEFSIEPLVPLLKSYEYIDDFPHLIPELYERFPDNPTLLLLFAEKMVANGNIEVVTSLLENRLEDFTENPGLAFYLISLYIHQNKLEKLEKPLNFLEKNFSDNSEVFRALQKINDELFQAQ